MNRSKPLVENSTGVFFIILGYLSWDFGYGTAEKKDVRVFAGVTFPFFASVLWKLPSFPYGLPLVFLLVKKYPETMPMCSFSPCSISFLYWNTTAFIPFTVPFMASISLFSWICWSVIRQHRAQILMLPDQTILLCFIHFLVFLDRGCEVLLVHQLLYCQCCCNQFLDITCISALSILKQICRKYFYLKLTETARNSDWTLYYYYISIYTHKTELS